MRQEMMGFWDGISISWTECKQSAPQSRQITTSTPHRSFFYRPDALPDAQPECQSTEGTTHITELTNNNNNNDRLTAFDPGQPG